MVGGCGCVASVALAATGSGSGGGICVGVGGGVISRLVGGGVGAAEGVGRGLVGGSSAPAAPPRRWVGCKGCWGRGSDGGDGKDALLVANLRIIAIIVACWRAWTATPVFSPAAALSGLAVPQSMSQPINRPISIMSSVWKFCSCAMKLLTAARSQSCWNR